MTNRLRFEMEPIPHPYPKSSEENYEAWGELSVFIDTPEGCERLLKTQWNLDDLAEVFAEHEQAWATDTFKIEGQPTLPNESLAYAISRLYDSEDDEELQDYLYSYNHTHSLETTMPGICIPDIIIGCNQSSGEISCTPWERASAQSLPEHHDCYAATDYTYAFDMGNFLNDTRSKLIAFMTQWRNGPKIHPNAIARANNIIAALEANGNLTECC